MPLDVLDHSSQLEVNLLSLTHNQVLDSIRPRSQSVHFELQLLEIPLMCCNILKVGFYNFEVLEHHSLEAGHCWHSLDSAGTA